MKTKQALPDTVVASHPISPALSIEDKAKLVHRTFPTGVTIITAYHDGGPIGLAVNAFSSVSMDPPTVLFCVNKNSKSHGALIEEKHLAINILSHAQKSTALSFAKSGGDKFKDVQWHPGVYGAPVLSGSAAAFEVQVEQTISASTHTIFIARVVDAFLPDGRDSLLYLDGKFFDGSRLTDA